MTTQDEFIDIHGLQAVANYLGVQFNHHAAGDDACAAAQIIRAVRKSDGASIADSLRPNVRRISVTARG